eukprot:s1_g1481.t1
MSTMEDIDVTNSDAQTESVQPDAPSGKTAAGGQIAPATFEHDDATDADNKRHRAKAVRVHRSRALKQIVHASTIVVGSAATPFYWLLASTADVNFGGVSDLLSPVVNGSPLVFEIVIPGVVLGICVLGALWLWAWYRRERDRDWAENTAKADASEPEQSADGYMQLFRLYARTKRRATFVMIYGVLSVWWSLVGLLAYAAAGNIHIVLALVITQLAVSIFIIYLGFDIGRRYLPGNVLVTKTLILGLRAATSQTDYQVALGEAQKIEERIIDRKPWWFYAYRTAPPLKS